MTAHFDGPAPLTDTITPQVPDRPRPAGPGDSGDLAGFAPDGLPGPEPDTPPDSARDALPDAAAATEAGPDMGAPHVSQ